MMRERYGADDVFRRVTTGRPSLRRAGESLGGQRLGAITDALSQDIDPQRWRSIYQQRLGEAVALEREAAPLRARDEGAALLAARHRGVSDKYDINNDELREGLARLPKWGSAAARFDPRGRMSTARQKFGNLFRG
jgi:hypothetical protein